MWIVKVWGLLFPTSYKFLGLENDWEGELERIIGGSN